LKLKQNGNSEKRYKRTRTGKTQLGVQTCQPLLGRENYFQIFMDFEKLVSESIVMSGRSYDKKQYENQ
jgi:hypothetical protein